MKQYKLPLIDGREIAFNSISAEDADRFYQAILSQPNNSDLEEYIFNVATDGRYKDDLASLDAGIILTIIYASFSLSGVLLDIKQFPRMIEEAREKTSGNAYNLLYSTIIKGMPSYNPDMLKAKGLNELLELFTMAENVLGGPQIDLNKLREILGSARMPKKGTGKYKEREGKGVALIKEAELKSLTKQLNFMEEGDFDDQGHYIGDGNML